MDGFNDATTSINFGPISITYVKSIDGDYVWISKPCGEGMECSCDELRELLLEFYRKNF